MVVIVYAHYPFVRIFYYMTNFWKENTSGNYFVLSCIYTIRSQDFELSCIYTIIMLTDFVNEFIHFVPSIRILYRNKCPRTPNLDPIFAPPLTVSEISAFFCKNGRHFLRSKMTNN